MEDKKFIGTGQLGINFEAPSQKVFNCTFFIEIKEFDNITGILNIDTENLLDPFKFSSLGYTLKGLSSDYDEVIIKSFFPISASLGRYVKYEFLTDEVYVNDLRQIKSQYIDQVVYYVHNFPIKYLYKDLEDIKESYKHKVEIEDLSTYLYTDQNQDFGPKCKSRISFNFENPKTDIEVKRIYKNFFTPVSFYLGHDINWTKKEISDGEGIPFSTVYRSIHEPTHSAELFDIRQLLENGLLQKMYLAMRDMTNEEVEAFNFIKYLMNMENDIKNIEGQAPLYLMSLEHLINNFVDKKCADKSIREIIGKKKTNNMIGTIIRWIECQINNETEDDVKDKIISLKSTISHGFDMSFKEKLRALCKSHKLSIPEYQLKLITDFRNHIAHSGHLYEFSSKHRQGIGGALDAMYDAKFLISTILFLNLNIESKPLWLSRMRFSMI